MRGCHPIVRRFRADDCDSEQAPNATPVTRSPPHNVLTDHIGKGRQLFDDILHTRFMKEKAVHFTLLDVQLVRFGCASDLPLLPNPLPAASYRFATATGHGDLPRRD